MSEKEFAPSHKRLLKARKQGRIAKSRMLNLAITWWALIGVLLPAFTWVRDGTLMRWMNYRVWTPQVAFAEATKLGFQVVCLCVGVVAVSGFLVGLAQSGGLFNPSQLLKGIEQYRPGAHIGRMKQSCVDAALGLLRCCFVVLLVGPLVLSIAEITPSAFSGIGGAAYQAFYAIIRGVFVRGGYALLIIGSVGYALARWRFFKQMRMSLQEMKDEHREDEGDQHFKAARKHEHKILLLSEIEKRVKRAKVVVVSRME